MIKKIIVTLMLSLVVALLCACSSVTSDRNAKESSPELQRLCRIDIYSAKDDSFIKSIEDPDLLNQFQKIEDEISELSDFSDNEKIADSLKNYTPFYQIISYKSPAAIYNDGELEKLSTLTIYTDTNVCKIEVAAENVKSFSVSSEYLAFYATLSEENMTFLSSLESVP